MSGTYLPPPKPVKRKLLGGPKHGAVATVSPAVRRLDIGWLTGHYELRDDGRFHFVSLADRPAPAKEAA